MINHDRIFLKPAGRHVSPPPSLGASHGVDFFEYFLSADAVSADRLRNALKAQVASGAISTEDEAALTTALDTIASVLQRGGSLSGSSTRPNSSQIKLKIDELISSSPVSRAR
jgi:hypothetical protein